MLYKFMVAKWWVSYVEHWVHRYKCVRVIPCSASIYHRTEKVPAGYSSYHNIRGVKFPASLQSRVEITCTFLSSQFTISKIRYSNINIIRHFMCNVLWLLIHLTAFNINENSHRRFCIHVTTQLCQKRASGKCYCIWIVDINRGIFN